MITVATDASLDAFRAAWGGDAVCRLLQQLGGRLLINWPVGVGKSRNIDDVIEAAVAAGACDLVVALAPTKQIIAERRWVAKPPNGVRVATLRSRPTRRCGPQRNEEWGKHEAAGLGLLGRKTICGACPHRKTCFWPEQYGKSLKGTKVIFAAQAHLKRDPFFIYQLSRWTGAKRILVILDEDKAMLTCFRWRIRRADLEMFTAVVKGPQQAQEKLGKWLELCNMLLAVRQTDDLRDRNWKVSGMWPGLAVQVQEAGHALFHDKFRYLGFDLQQFFRSPLVSRELHSNGDITFAAPPQIGTHLLVYSGTAIPEFCEFRLGIKLANPFGDYRFIHAGTRWYNIASRIGARKYFLRNSAQILDFFAGLVAKRLRDGRRPLLVSKKCFIAFCAKEMTHRLKAIGFPKIKIVTGNWEKYDLSDPQIIPLLNYGVVGTNLFEQFDCAYCLNSYYVSEHVINAVVQDVLAADGYVQVKIETGGTPLRRSVAVVNREHELCDVQQLANYALRQQELDVVIQTVGRVRPFTKSREIITFQAAEHPSIRYEREFSFLDQARKFFGIPTARALKKETTTSKVQAAKAQGMTQAETVQTLKLSLATVKRRWSAGVTNPDY